jgi:phytoene dehydrogenase-like protein
MVGSGQRARPVVVIGAGHNGLCAAIELARAGRELVLARSLRSHHALEAENPSLVRGDILGGRCDPDQQLLFRPAPRLVRHRTPVRGLYLAGASVHPGGGVHGVPGAGAARALMRDQRRRRRGRRS